MTTLAFAVVAGIVALAACACLDAKYPGGGSPA